MSFMRYTPIWALRPNIGGGAIHTDRVRQLLRDSITNVASDMDATVTSVEADGDHLHILVQYPPQLAISSLVNSMKGDSSRLLRKRNWPQVQSVLWGKSFWSPSYCVVSCGGAPLDIVKAYIEDQNSPHRDRRGAEYRAAKRKKKIDQPN